MRQFVQGPLLFAANETETGTSIHQPASKSRKSILPKKQEQQMIRKELVNNANITSSHQSNNQYKPTSPLTSTISTASTASTSPSLHAAMDHIHGGSDNFKSSYYVLPHNHGPYIDISIHLRLQFKGFELVKKPTDIQYIHEVTNWLSSPERHVVFESLALRSIMVLGDDHNDAIDNSKNVKVHPRKVIFVSSDNDRVKHAFIRYLKTYLESYLDLHVLLRTRNTLPLKWNSQFNINAYRYNGSTSMLFSLLSNVDMNALKSAVINTDSHAAAMVLGNIKKVLSESNNTIPHSLAHHQMKSLSPTTTTTTATTSSTSSKSSLHKQRFVIVDRRHDGNITHCKHYQDMTSQNPHAMRHLVFDWYSLSLSRHILAYRRPTVMSSTFVQSAMLMHRDTDNWMDVDYKSHGLFVSLVGSTDTGNSSTTYAVQWSRFE